MNFTTLEHLGLDHVMKRGTGEILETGKEACLLRDTVSDVFFLACEDVKTGLAMLGRHAEKIDVLMTSNVGIGKIALARYGFDDCMECYQVAYFGKIPATDERLTMRVADLGDFQIIAENYHQCSDDDLKRIILRGSILLGYYEGQLVGFIGEHLEGSMGLLYVFPAFRRMGFAYSLESAKIAEFLKKGFVPFAQVDKNNAASLALQKKLGMKCSEHTILWLWKKED
ncbi:MAG: GNAT family N-acetyltransferase [Clostridia bacterium]|nr:GNAT family N-acetyltransferase [Clostridia bacterium]